MRERHMRWHSCTILCCSNSTSWFLRNGTWQSALQQYSLHHLSLSVQTCLAKIRGVFSCTWCIQNASDAADCIMNSSLTYRTFWACFLFSHNHYRQTIDPKRILDSPTQCRKHCMGRNVSLYLSYHLLCLIIISMMSTELIFSSQRPDRSLCFYAIRQTYHCQQYRACDLWQSCKQ